MLCSRACSFAEAPSLCAITSNARVAYLSATGVKIRVLNARERNWVELTRAKNLLIFDIALFPAVAYAL